MDYIKQAAQIQQKHQQRRIAIKQKSFDTIAVHGIYDLDEALKNQGSIIEPVYMTPAQAFRDSDELKHALAYEIPGWVYTRIHNPSLYYLEQTLSLLESYQCPFDANACVTSSGMAAIMMVADALLADTHDGNFISSSQIYGGSFQQFSVRQHEKNRQVRFVDADGDIEQWENQIDDNTRFIYIEVPSNPSLSLCDIKALASLSHKYHIPLVVDATLASPALIRPLSLGADIVIHSLSKIITASGVSIGGVVIARENLNAHYLDNTVKKDFATYLKLLPGRDNGACLSPMQAFQILTELRTLRARVDQLSHSTMKVAQYLQSHPAIDKVLYPGLTSHPQHALAKDLFQLVDAQKYSDDHRPLHRYGNLVSFSIKGDDDTAAKLLDRLSLIFRATDLGRIKSVATIPAISTHQQQGEEGRTLAHIPTNLIRLSIGGEYYGDIIDDLDQAIAYAQDAQKSKNTSGLLI
ncbi:MAG: aminotransferase class I/II-fold pyridoxal phosphate-dependent enzyme [Francisellaceae bacterium]